MLKKHLYHEWILSCVHQTDEPSFLVEGNIIEQFKNILPLVDKFPFSLVKIESQTGRTELEADDGRIIKPNFSNQQCTSMSKHLFCSPSDSTNFFHKLQRERKIWWRKFSALPSRFTLAEITYNDCDNSQSVGILADFPWGTEEVETIRCYTNLEENLKAKNGRKTFSPCKVVTECFLEKAALLYICDAFDPINENTDREMMRFHRKLAPYKVSFAASATSASIAKELTDLALVLARKIRKTEILCLLLSDFTKKSLDTQFSRTDAMGVPYTIVLNDRTLSDGMLGLRSRDTTLKEQSHVGLIVPYMEQIMKNY